MKVSNEFKSIELDVDKKIAKINGEDRKCNSVCW